MLSESESFQIDSNVISSLTINSDSEMRLLTNSGEVFSTTSLMDVDSLLSTQPLSESVLSVIFKLVK